MVSAASSCARVWRAAGDSSRRCTAARASGQGSKEGEPGAHAMRRAPRRPPTNQAAGIENRRGPRFCRDQPGNRRRLESAPRPAPPGTHAPKKSAPLPRLRALSPKRQRGRRRAALASRRTGHGDRRPSREPPSPRSVRFSKGAGRMATAIRELARRRHHARILGMDCRHDAALARCSCTEGKNDPPADCRAPAGRGQPAGVNRGKGTDALVRLEPFQLADCARRAGAFCDARQRKRSVSHAVPPGFTRRSLAKVSCVVNADLLPDCPGAPQRLMSLPFSAFSQHHEQDRPP